jgi:pathogenesis-related protein 1
MIRPPLTAPYGRQATRMVALAAALALVPSAARPQVFSQADKKAILIAHNRVRCLVSPAAQTMPALVWSTALEETAQAWASACVDIAAPFGVIDHNPDRSADHPYYVGENIFASGSTATPTQAVNVWASESANYNFPANTCSGACGHYTQVVWANSRDLGCARASCPALANPSGIVCDYGPGGNTGSRPYTAGSGVTEACDLIYADGFQPPSP